MMRSIGYKKKTNPSNQGVLIAVSLSNLTIWSDTSAGGPTKNSICVCLSNQLSWDTNISQKTEIACSTIGTGAVRLTVRNTMR